MFFTKKQLYKLPTNLMILESREKAKNKNHFDVFLSHNYEDQDYIYELKKIIESYGLVVYVDWLIDINLDRNNVSTQTAELLKLRMNQSDWLFFATSQNSASSKWMPWELGYFDGFKGNIAIIPILEHDNSIFRGQEYLSLYPVFKIDDIRRLALLAKLEII